MLQIALGGENYVFWGGREGYMSLLNTDMQREKIILPCSRISRKIMQGHKDLKVPSLLNPNHASLQSTSTITTVKPLWVLRKYDLINDFKLNVEGESCDTGRHTFTHELQVAADAGMLGGIDANRGDYQNGWDTDQFPNDINELTEAMLIILRAGGFAGGASTSTQRSAETLPTWKIFYAHIGGMDIFARGLVTANNILENGELPKLRKTRYASWRQRRRG